jgi:transcriptional regulator with GAF, ATPase, and Fis domain
MTHATLGLCMIGESEVFKAMPKTPEMIAAFDAPVLISQENGSCKEAAARAIHCLGRRRDLPFVPDNCGTLPDHPVENEWFGHWAARKRKGH